MSEDHSLRDNLLKLVDRIRGAREHGGDDIEALAEFERLLPCTDVHNLCNSEAWDDETIVDYCLGERDARHKCTREELLTLVERLLVHGFLTDAESHLAVATFDFNCMHPASTDLIFYPEDYFEGRSDPTPEEIVDKALCGQ